MAVVQVRTSAQRIRKPGREDSVSALTGVQWAQYGIIVIMWSFAVIYFASFWLSSRRIDSLPLYIIVTVAFFYEAIFSISLYLFFVGHMRVPRHIPAPAGIRVAIVSPCVPSKESLEIIERQVRSLVAVTYPHDSWILDEEDDPLVAALCQQYGVHHFSRKGVAKWNQPHAPFQAKTKAGNVNAWLFEHGVAYELFVQMDIDHVPVPHYLDRTLGHFRDERVAWVQAPSVYGNMESWAARGSSEQNMMLHGPLQMGFYGFCYTPVIIGSHTTYRTSAMLAIGGMQPTRAEDHLDTVVFTQHGYVGVFVPERIATGDGPENFETFLAQEFAWAYSMCQILFQYTRKNFRRYPLRTIPAMMFMQTWYPLWSFSLLVLFTMPPLMVITDLSSARIPLIDFIGHFLPLPLCTVIICWWTGRWFQPAGLRLGWRGVVLNTARWPVQCWAVIQSLFKVKKPYMITPKGQGQHEIPPFNLRAQRPYIGFIVASLSAVWWYTSHHRNSAAQGYLFYLFLGVAFMLAVYWAAICQDIVGLRRRGVAKLRSLRLRQWPIALGACMLLATFASVSSSRSLLIESALWRGDALPVAATEPGGIVAAALPTAIAASPTLPQFPASATSSSSGTPTRRLATRTPVSRSLPTPFLGAYDPQEQLLDGSFQVEAFYSGLSETALAQLPARLDDIRERGRVPLLTVEPHPLSQRTPIGGTVLTDITAGSYDAQLQQVASIVNQFGARVLIRFGQEMDIVDLYPWSTDEPTSYIAAYRHAHRIVSSQLTSQVTWVWSPAGNLNAAAYYPGDDVVDYVGFTVLGSHDFDLDSGTTRRRSFRELMDEKYPRLQRFGKPLVVAELGVSGDETLQTDWLRDLTTTRADYPELIGLIYYNDFNAINHLVPNPPNYSITSRQWQTSGMPALLQAPNALSGAKATVTPPPTAAPSPVATLPAASASPASFATPPPVVPETATPSPIIPVATAPAFVATQAISAGQPTNFRAGPGTSFAIVATLPIGTPLMRINKAVASDGMIWYQFRLLDGRMGWVREVDVGPIRP